MLCRYLIEYINNKSAESPDYDVCAYVDYKPNEQLLTFKPRFPVKLKANKNRRQLSDQVAAAVGPHIHGQESAI